MVAKLKKVQEKQKKGAERAYAEGGFEAMERNDAVKKKQRRKELNRLAQKGAAGSSKRRWRSTSETESY